MRARTTKRVNIRSGAARQGAPSKGTLNPGFEIDVEPVHGESIEGNDIWYVDGNGDFLWSGGFVVTATTTSAPSPPTTTARTTSGDAIDRDRLFEQLVLHEGLRLKPYQDTVGKLTIGIGRNLDDVGISEEEARMLAENDVDAAERVARDIVPAFDNLDEIRQRVLIDMAFNLGRKLGQFRRMIAAVEARQFATAADEMLDSQWAGQVGPRSTRLAEMMRSGQDYVA